MNTPTTPNYNVDYFIAKFSAIPEERWITGVMTDKNKYCALGHCGAGNPLAGNADFNHTEESKALNKLFKANFNEPAWKINDSKDYGYPQSTPKQRILAALQDIKKAQLDAQYKEDCMYDGANY